ncbi:hypothetical protein P3X46_005235 [Hevea brasiliensis]|uniref:Carbohydrate kinase PfkB domain-containing protein n=1 Tax=Hevea brasiliensis TaxID=3981 RepID=A0ABQ9MZB7_HEVBR|nr:hypothetical protein P3X46_005235 [Hevea brasiliensis]
MSFSLLSLPPTTAALLSPHYHSPFFPPIFSLYPHSSLYGYTTTITILPCHYRPRERCGRVGSMDKRLDGHFRVSSCSSFEGGREEGELDGRSWRGQNEKGQVGEENFESGREEEEEDIEALSPTAVLPERWDVLGLGQAMVDFSGMVDDEFLERLGLEKGIRKVVNHEERGRVLRAMDGCSYKAAAGGSLSNSLVALARLGCKPISGPALNVAMAGSVGSDPLGGFYRAKLRRANVNFLSAPKGTRKVVNHEERGRVLRAMDGCSYKAAAGGSLSNSLVALARLGCKPISGPALNVAMAGSVGSDPLGGFYRAKLRRANVNFLSAPVKDGTTGTVIVLTTPDAQRTMLSYQGTSSSVNYDPCLATIVSKTNILVVEGYLFELPDTIKTITRACEAARRSGALVAITASDVSCIERHYDDFWEIVENYADVVFANSDEARALCDFAPEESAISAARYLSHFVPLVSVTDGPRGSYIGVKGEAVYIPPFPCVPVDTCGAGDAYASGILYGILRGISDLKGMGTLAARIAATVVGQRGTRLRVHDALKLAESFAFNLEINTIRSDVGSDHVSSL